MRGINSIGEILKAKQPNEFEKLRKKQRRRKSSHRELTEADIKELMRHSSYRRINGAIRQVR